MSTLDHMSEKDLATLLSVEHGKSITLHFLPTIVVHVSRTTHEGEDTITLTMPVTNGRGVPVEVIRTVPRREVEEAHEFATMWTRLPVTRSG